MRALLPIVLLAIAPTAASRERVLDGDAIIDTVVAGQRVRLRVDPAAPAMPLIDRGVAERAQLTMTGSWGVGIGYRIGTSGVMARTQVVRVDLGSGAAKRRVGWTDTEADAPVARRDPDEIIVIATGKKRDIRRDTISLGADYLSRCSSIVFDKPAKVIRLTCS